MNATKITRLTVDLECNAETWWDAAREAIERFPASCRPLLEMSGDDSVYVSPEDADAFMAVAETLPEWDDGPEFAPNPILRYDSEEFPDEASDASAW